MNKTNDGCFVGTKSGYKNAPDQKKCSPELRFLNDEKRARDCS